MNIEFLLYFAPKGTSAIWKNTNQVWHCII